MKLSQYFFKTLKESPGDAELRSHKILIRGGYVKQIASGIFSTMPLGKRVLRKIEGIIREEMEAVGGQEVHLPVVMPATLWQETKRYEDVGPEMLRFEDRVGRKMVLGMTHEEAATDLARNVVSSYKQLPFMIYQFQTKFRDEARSRGGLVRVREFIMKDGYSFHSSEKDLEEYYDKCLKAYFRIFKRCGLPVISVSSDTGMMGGSGADEFMAITEKGEDSLVICSSCDYRANREVARAYREPKQEKPLPLEKTHTPGKKSIEELSSFLQIAPSQTMKGLAYTNERAELILCFIRGDLDLNETKLRNFTRSKVLELASAELLSKKNLLPGYLGPIGLNDEIRIIFDESIEKNHNLVCGANELDYHFINSNWGRDFSGKEITDLSEVKEGESCPRCKGALEIKRGIEVGNIFKLGTKYSKDMNGVFLDEQGKTKNMVMGCYGIGLGRLMASVLELGQDNAPVKWPLPIAPFEVLLIGLALDKSPQGEEAAERVYQDLTKANLEVLYDERKLSPGVKFKDSELLGIPLQIVIGERSLDKGGAEVSIENGEKSIIPLSELLDWVHKEKSKLLEKYAL